LPYLSACRGDDRVGGWDDVKRLRAAVVKGARERRIVCRAGGAEQNGTQHRHTAEYMGTIWAGFYQIGFDM
jgi:hypothetical protein